MTSFENILNNKEFLRVHSKSIQCPKNHKLDFYWWGKECPYCKNMEFYPKHVDSRYCWCEPELFYTDKETGNEVWVHKEIQ